MPLHDDSSIGSDDTSCDGEEEGPTWDMNVLSEGEYYVAMSMLVYIYALLRETSMVRKAKHYALLPRNFCLGLTQYSYDLYVPQSTAGSYRHLIRRN